MNTFFRKSVLRHLRKERYAVLYEEYLLLFFGDIECLILCSPKHLYLYHTPDGVPAPPLPKGWGMETNPERSAYALVYQKTFLFPRSPQHLARSILNALSLLQGEKQ